MSIVTNVPVAPHGEATAAQQLIGTVLPVWSTYRILPNKNKALVLATRWNGYAPVHIQLTHTGVVYDEDVLITFWLGRDVYIGTAKHYHIERAGQVNCADVFKLASAKGAALRNSFGLEAAEIRQRIKAAALPEAVVERRY